VNVEADRIFIADGAVWSSAGVTAGIDLALALIEADHGSETARQVARELVVYHRRSGGQSQFAPISRMEPTSDRIRIALTFARDHLHEPLPIERLADAAHLSIRQFGRAFQQLGNTIRISGAHRAIEQSYAEPGKPALACNVDGIPTAVAEVSLSLMASLCAPIHDEK
jgi:transcriptional regulator GlxA family with amidase domain